MAILIVGIPNAGKTTFSERFGNVIHADEYPEPRYLTFPKAVKEIGIGVVAEGFVNSARCRKDFIEAAGDGEKICIWLDTPLEVCVERERQGRKRGYDFVERLAERFEPPTYDEGWDEIIIVRGKDGDNDKIMPL